MNKLAGLGKSMWISIALLIVSVILYGSFRAGVTTFSELEMWGTITASGTMDERINTCMQAISKLFT